MESNVYSLWGRVLIVGACLPEVWPEAFAALAAEAEKLLGRRTSARAVGAAVGRNPISIILPCHRVLGAKGSLTGYAGGLDKKEWLLRHEGAI